LPPKKIAMLQMIIFTVIITMPVFLYWLYVRKKYEIDYRKILSYFLFGSWFGMCGEVFIDAFVNKLLQLPIPLWEYRIMPIHNAMTSSYGPIMWGVAAVGICFYQNYSAKKKMKVNKFGEFLIESWFLMFSELFFDITAYFYLGEYFFYYYSPEFLHFSAFVNIPMWWCGYKMIVKVSEAMNRQEKITIPLAIMMIITMIWGF
jgi:hypothetical protein